MQAPWGAWRPDVAGPNSGFARQADGVRPVAIAGGGMGYAPQQDLTTLPQATALASAPRGAITLVLEDGTWETFVATATTIEQLQTDYTWSSIDTGLTLPAGDDTSFVHWGSKLLNSNSADGLYAYDVESPGTNDVVSAAPKAKFIFPCNEVLFALNCDGNDKRMESSGQGDYTEWALKGSDGKTFEDGGALIAGGDLENGNALILQERAVHLVTFGTGPTGALYGIKKLADGIGAVHARSVVFRNGACRFLATDGWYEATAAGVRSIGALKVDETFLLDLDLTAITGVQGCNDPRRKMTWWRYKALTNTSTTVYDRMIGYHWGIQEWVTAPANTTWLINLATAGFVADDLDSFGPADSIDIPMDDPFWQGGSPVFAGLDASSIYASFSGGSMAATLEGTPRNSPVTGLISWATPESDAPNSTLALGVSDSLATPVVFKDGVGKTAGGDVPLRGRGKVIAFRENIPAGEDWTFSNGVDFVRAAGGGRK